MIGIYCIENKQTGKKYVGKSKDIAKRLSQHKYALKKGTHHNDYLQNAYKRYGKESFEYYVLEELDKYDPIKLSFMEMDWIDFLNSFDNEYGYNLLYDSPDGYIFHEYAKAKRPDARGPLNPNYGNHWTDEQKDAMSNIAKERHAKGIYGDEWKAKISVASSRTWKDEEKKTKMALAVSESKSNSDFFQYRRDGSFVAVWKDLKQILVANPNWKWQNIYAACNGSKKSYRGFLWERKPKVAGKFMFYTPDGAFEDYDDEFDPFLETT